MVAGPNKPGRSPPGPAVSRGGRPMRSRPGTHSPHEDHHLQLVDVIRSVRRHWRVSLGILLVTGVVLGVFLFTRSEVRDPDRWQASIQLLVPARDEDGALPEGVPPSLLQGQAVIALSAETTAEALKSVGLDETARDDVEFGFASNERGDILTLTATAPTAGTGQRHGRRLRGCVHRGPARVRRQWGDLWPGGRSARPRDAGGSAGRGRRRAARPRSGPLGLGLGR